MFSFSYTCLMCVRVVLWEIVRSSAMYFALRPSAMSSRISSSRGVRPFSAASFWQYARISDGIPSSAPVSCPACGASAAVGSAASTRARFFGTDRANCRHTLIP